MTIHDHLQAHLGWLAIELAKAKAERDEALAEVERLRVEWERAVEAQKEARDG